MSLPAAIGLDIGTSGARALVVDVRGRVKGSAAAPYRLRAATPGAAEQEPADWWEAARETLGEAWREAGEPPLEGVGLCGQMHGTVLVDANLRPLRPALLWCDDRAAATATAVERRFGRERLIETSGNPALPGFTAPQLRMLAERGDPALERARWAFCAKDFVRAQLTEEAAGEHSDASGTGLYSVREGGWDERLAAAYGVRRELLPPLLESGEAAGSIGAGAADATGLAAGTPVAAGAADNAAAALGAGVVAPGELMVSIGSSGTLLAPLREPVADPSGACHLFRHALPETWYALAVVLDAGAALTWWQRLTGVPLEQLAAEAAAAEAGSGGVVALPHLSGRRMPKPVPAGSAALTGLSLAHGRGEVTRALVEGVGYALADGLACLGRIGIEPERAVLAGGGTAHLLWRQALALALPSLAFERARVADCAALGAALLGFAAAGRPLEEVLAEVVASREEVPVETDPAARRTVAAGYARYAALSGDPLLYGRHREEQK